MRDDTLIVFTSDHGEGFGEHGLYLHANSFFSELVHVPLIIAGPGITSGKRVTEPVSHVDLMPTLRRAGSELPLGTYGRGSAGVAPPVHG